MKRVLCVVGMCAGIGAAGLVALPDQHAEVRAAITAANRAFSAAYVRGDAAAMAGMYTTDGVLLPPGRLAQGRAAIERFFTPGASRKLIAHSLTTEDLRVYGDVVVEIGRWSSTSSTAGAEPVTNADRYLLVWHRQSDGSWRISHDMWHIPPK